jgi:hypothetical protein
MNKRNFIKYATLGVASCITSPISLVKTTEPVPGLGSEKDYLCPSDRIVMEEIKVKMSGCAEQFCFEPMDNTVITRAHCKFNNMLEDFKKNGQCREIGVDSLSLNDKVLYGQVWIRPNNFEDYIILDFHIFANS